MRFLVLFLITLTPGVAAAEEVQLHFDGQSDDVRKFAQEATRLLPTLEGADREVRFAFDVTEGAGEFSKELVKECPSCQPVGPIPVPPPPSRPCTSAGTVSFTVELERVRAISAVLGDTDSQAQFAAAEIRGDRVLLEQLQEELGARCATCRIQEVPVEPIPSPPLPPKPCPKPTS